MGSYGNEAIDAAAFVEWGFEFVKHDTCGTDYTVHNGGLQVWMNAWVLHFKLLNTIPAGRTTLCITADYSYEHMVWVLHLVLHFRLLTAGYRFE